MTNNFKKYWAHKTTEVHIDVEDHSVDSSLSEEELKSIDKAIIEKQDNPWAICHGQGLTGDKFERCVMHVKEQVGKTFDTANAGNVPNSLLARQDLEGTTKSRKPEDIEFDMRECERELQRHTQDPDTYISLRLRYRKLEDELIRAKREDETKKDITGAHTKLNQIAFKAEDATETERKSLIARMKDIQMVRRSQELKTRGIGKSFSRFWKERFEPEIKDETEGEAHYRDMASKFESMADDEAKHKETLETMKSKYE